MNLKIKKVKFQRNRVKLDEIIKLLFTVSKEMLVNTLNGLFNESYNPDDVDVKVSKTATEFVKDNLDVIIADTFLKLETVDTTRPYHYHIEYQLTAGKMVLRVFEYAIMKTLENNRTEKDSGRTTLYIPKSLVIHFVESRSIPDKYELDIVFPNGEVQAYSVDVMKYWAVNDEQLIDRKLYNLLPLQVFLLRAELDKVTKNKDEESRQAAITQAYNLTEKIANAIMELVDEGKVTIDDADKIMIGLKEIFKHLNNRYNVNTALNEEVDIMTKTLLDKKLVDELNMTKSLLDKDLVDELNMMKSLLDKDLVEELKKVKKDREKTAEAVAEEIAVKLFDVLDVEIIAKKTELSVEKVKELKEKYSNKKDMVKNKQ